MRRKALVAVLSLLFIAFHGWQPCQAGIFDQVSGAVNQATGTYNKIKKGAKDLGLQDSKENSTANSSSQSLPGGIASRVKKANKELDKADNTLAKGAGTQADRVARAKQYLDRALKYRGEIDKRYKGKFSPDNPQIKALDQRLAAMSETVSQGDAASARASQPVGASGSSGTAASAKLPSAVVSRLKKANREMDHTERVLGNTVISADDRAKQAAYNLKQAKYYLDEIAERYGSQAPAGHPQMKEVLDRYALMESKVRQAGDQAAQADKKQAAPAGGQELSDQWVEKLKPYAVSGSGKEFLPYDTRDQAQWDKWDAIWAELGPLWREYQATQFPGPKSSSLKGYESQLSRQVENYKQLSARRMREKQEAKAMQGEIVFAKKRIDPNNPTGLTNSFEAGDNIYALITVKKPWAEIFRKPKDVPVRINVTLDGRKIHAQFITLHNPEHAKRQWLEMEIAPDEDDIKAYSDADMEYGKSKANLRQGPMELTQHLSKLSGGKHKMELAVYYYGKDWAVGSFEIRGSDFSDYADLHQKAVQAVSKATTLPRAKQKNHGLAGKMRKIVVDAGWPDPYRINIIDKDWWLNRVSGGNSPISSRHVAAAVMAEDGNGYFYKICTFEQQKLITGAWGPLELSHTGDRVPIREENKDK